jgi:predicted phage terminase large subunit-like protein
MAICGHGRDQGAKEIDYGGRKIRVPNKQFRGMIQGAKILWIAPTYGVLDVIEQELTKALGSTVTHRGSPVHQFVMPSTGGEITLKSATKPDRIRGANYDGIIVDEAAFMTREALDVASPTSITKANEWRVIVSTPMGQNWFHEEFQKAATESDYQRWHLPSSISPLITKEKLEKERRRMTSLNYQREYEAAFLIGVGSLIKMEMIQRYELSVDEIEETSHDMFGQDVKTKRAVRIIELHGANERRVRLEDCTLYQTVDLAFTEATGTNNPDFTVVSTFAITPSNDIVVLEVIRRQMSGAGHIKLFKECYNRWKPDGGLWIEANGPQKVIYDLALKAGLPACAYKPGTQSKEARANAIVAKFEHHDVYHPYAADWLGDVETELTAFPSKNGHDDIVDTYAIMGNKMPGGDSDVPAVVFV